MTQPNLYSPPSLAPLLRLAGPDLQKVNQEMLGSMESDILLIPEVASYLFNSGGKRIRPLLTIATAHMGEYKGNNHITLASSVEFIHTATLLHDDVVDESHLRRGKETVNKVWTNKTSILVGDFLFSRAFQLMVQVGDLKVLKILSDTSATIAEGEVHQLMIHGDLTMNFADYYRVIVAKTAKLFSASCEVGGRVAGLDDKKCHALASFGLNLGLAFQLIDDALDYVGDEKTLGKAPGDDFREAKVTYPVLLAYEFATDKEFWDNHFTHQKPQDFAEAKDLMLKANIFNIIDQKAQEYGDEALKALSVFPPSPYKEALKEAVLFTIHRSF